MKAFKISDRLEIKVYTESIFSSNLECDAIAISVFKKQLYERNKIENVGLVKESLKTFGTELKQNFNKELKKLPKKMDIDSQCLVLKIEKKRQKYLFNSILNYEYFKDCDKFTKMMEKSLENLVEKINQYSDIKCIAIPLLATGLSKGSMSLCSDILINTVIDFEKQGKILSLKEFHFVNIEDSKTKILIDKLEEIMELILKDEYELDKSNVKNLSDNKSIKLSEKKKCSLCKQKINNVKLFECGHSFCNGCQGDINESNTKCLIKNCSVKNEKPKKEDINVEKTCEICFDDFITLKKLEKCGHELCINCYKRTFESKPQCPFCLMLYGIPKGNQPSNGKMNTSIQKFSLPGFNKIDTIVINYNFSSGIQCENHPHPGRHYTGTSRTAYLPATEKGYKALELLKKAFENKLVFTIGISVTTGHEGITWNDIHHKTQINGPYGYPDGDYLDRLFEELKSHGIE